MPHYRLAPYMPALRYSFSSPGGGGRFAPSSGELAVSLSRELQ